MQPVTYTSDFPLNPKDGDWVYITNLLSYYEFIGREAKWLFKGYDCPLWKRQQLAGLLLNGFSDPDSTTNACSDQCYINLTTWHIFTCYFTNQERNWTDRGVIGASSVVTNVQVSYTAQEAITAGTLVTNDGFIVDITNADHRYKILGIATADLADGATGLAIISGEVVDGGWTWDISSAYPVWYTATGLSQTPPDPDTTTNKFSIIIGFPTSATKLCVNKQGVTEMN